ncbi:MAG: molecular chaperone TorD family protein [Deferribacteraceae bacterium]|jgi:TorA maturation chaperone TorD|nr:molecular chaperone TorD family protein [Deferribacteraceae bacterium]
MDEFIDFLKLRADVYNLLSVVFYKELDEKHTENLNKHIPVLKEYASLCGYNEMLKYADLLGEYLVSAPDYEKEACEFARLFLGVAKASTGHTITPHESVFLSPDRLVMQEPWEEIRKIYHETNVSKDKEFKEPEDHITSEMSYIAHVSRKMAETLANGGNGIDEAKAQISFLRNHIERWMPLLVKDIMITSSSGYFKYAAGLAEQYVMSDRALLEEWLSGNTLSE